HPHRFVEIRQDGAHQSLRFRDAGSDHLRKSPAPAPCKGPRRRECASRCRLKNRPDMRGRHGYGGPGPVDLYPGPGPKWPVKFITGDTMQFEAPETTKAAVALLAKAKGRAYVLAGGSDLLVRMKGGFIEPDLIVDIKRIKAMREVKKTASGFSIGAAVSCAEMGENKALRKTWPGVVEAANLIGSKQVQ